MKYSYKKYILLFILLYSMWVFGIPFIFSKAVPVLCRNITYNTNYNIEIVQPKLKLNILPKAELYVKSLSYGHKEQNDCICIKDLKINTRILPLLSGRIHINSITADVIDIKTALQNKIIFDKTFFQKIQNPRFKCDTINVQTFNVHAIGENNTLAYYRGKNIYYKKNNKYIKFNLESIIEIQNNYSVINTNLYLPQDNNINKSKINIKIENFNLQPIAEFLRLYLPQDIVKIQGIINLTADKNNLSGELKNCAVIMNDNAKSIAFPKKTDIEATFDITSKRINFKTIRINSENIHTLISGTLLNYLNKSLTTLNLSVTIDNSKTEDIISLLPPIVLEEINIYKLKKYNFLGDVIGNFTIKGNCKAPDVNGEIYLTNGILIKPIPKAKGASIKINLLGKYLTFDVVVPASPAEKVWVKGGVELYNVKYADMHIWSTKNIDLKTAEEKILPLHEILNFIIGPVPIMNIQGMGNIDIIVKGNRKNPHVWGTFNANNVTTFFNNMPDLVLKNADAALVFNDENVTFKTTRGTVDGKSIDITGTCNLAGNFDFYVKAANQNISYILNSIKTSTMIDDIKNILPNFSVAQGLINIDLRVYGAVKYIEDLAFNKNFFTSGNIELLGNNFGVLISKNIPEINIKNARGIINFDGMNAKAKIEAFLNKSKLKISAIITNNIADINLDIPKLNLLDILPYDNQLIKDTGNLNVSVKAAYKGKIDKIEYNKIKLDAKVLNSANNKINVSNGTINIKNDKIIVNNLCGTLLDTKSSFRINLNIFGLSTRTPQTNGLIELKDFELPIINTFLNYSFIPNNFRSLKFNNGKLNLNCKINNNKINTYANLGGVCFTYLPFDLPIKIINGSLSVHNNVLKLNKINTILDEMPLLLDGDISNPFSNPDFNLYINSKPKQDFIDKYINKNRIYPIKIKGDVVSTAKIKGTADNYSVKANLKLAQGAYIYYLGATVGDIENSIILDINSHVLMQNFLKIKEFSYDKIISSLGTKYTRLNMLKAHGGIKILNDDLIFHDLYIKTNHPTDARIFNIIFRKPNIKQGQFTSDLHFNGKLSDPKLLGTFHIFETNIPFLDTTMKNITFVFKNKTIDISSVGEILGNDITFHGILKNKLTLPYYVENVQIDTKLLDLNSVINKIKLSQADNLQTQDAFDSFSISSIIVKNLKMNADTVKLKNIVAEDFEAKSSLNEDRVLHINNFTFRIANGELKGNVLYNLSNNNTKLELKAKDIDADALSIALFDLKNQIDGDLTGDISLACNGSDFDNCMKTLNGKLAFNVEEGKMPKLGSLEYLLKAGNLLKGGLTGISINSVIDIITPLKTGEFSNIYGFIKINNGIANNIEITTKGKDLSLFMTGTYNCSTAIAEMEVFGLLSKKISTMFGPLGNVSLNTLFNVIPGIDLTKDSVLLLKINKIPGIEISNKSFRKFVAEIKGNINGDNYVKSFKWIN